MINLLIFGRVLGDHKLRELNMSHTILSELNDLLDEHSPEFQITMTGREMIEHYKKLEPRTRNLLDQTSILEDALVIRLCNDVGAMEAEAGRKQEVGLINSLAVYLLCLVVSGGVCLFATGLYVSSLLYHGEKFHSDIIDYVTEKVGNMSSDKK